MSWRADRERPTRDPSVNQLFSQGLGDSQAHLGHTTGPNEPARRGGRNKRRTEGSSCHLLCPEGRILARGGPFRRWCESRSPKPHA